MAAPARLRRKTAGFMPPARVAGHTCVAVRIEIKMWAGKPVPPGVYGEQAWPGTPCRKKGDMLSRWALVKMHGCGNDYLYVDGISGARAFTEGRGTGSPPRLAPGIRTAWGRMVSFCFCP